MESNKKPILTSIRVSSAGHQPPPGVTRGKCTSCGKAVYLSPSSVKMMETVEVDIVCDVCIPTVMAGSRGVEFAIAPGAAQELAAYMKKVHLN